MTYFRFETGHTKDYLHPWLFDNYIFMIMLVVSRISLPFSTNIACVNSTPRNNVTLVYLDTVVLTESANGGYAFRSGVRLWLVGWTRYYEPKVTQCWVGHPIMAIMVFSLT